MEHDTDFLCRLVEIAKHQPGFVGPAVDGGSGAGSPNRYRLVLPIGEAAAFERANGFENLEQLDSLGAGGPGGDAGEQRLQGKETMEVAGSLGFLPSCSLRTLTSSWRYSITFCCLRLIQPARQTRKN